ncbi:MAG TPA: type II toxin-antitoxin system VapC family toxin [Phycisphaerales bacterium]|nr:type II toxin-antitoxin system VapC family toxin [Phycisphaerales bacterium]
MVVLDTTVLIDLMREGTRSERAADAVRRVFESGERPATTRFNVAELYVGVERSRSPTTESGRVERVLEGLDILEFDERAARVFGRLAAHTGLRGRPAGDMGLLIASVAIVCGATLVTRNARHFAGLPGLSIVSY